MKMMNLSLWTRIILKHYIILIWGWKKERENFMIEIGKVKKGKKDIFVRIRLLLFFQQQLLFQFFCSNIFITSSQHLFSALAINLKILSLAACVKSAHNKLSANIIQISSNVTLALLKRGNNAPKTPGFLKLCLIFQKF